MLTELDLAIEYFLEDSDIDLLRENINSVIGNFSLNRYDVNYNVDKIFTIERKLDGSGNVTIDNKDIRGIIISRDGYDFDLLKYVEFKLYSLGKREFKLYQ